MSALRLSRPDAGLFVADGCPEAEALARTTHLAVGAHPDDLEIMAFEGIGLCYDSAERWFTGVVVCDGASSPRAGRFAALDDAGMRERRRDEQRRAAELGGYGAQLLLDHPSTGLRGAAGSAVVEDLVALLRATRPEVVYTHDLADRHDSHVAVALRLIDAARRLPAGQRPSRVLGCEVWRGLDWLSDQDRQRLDVSARPDLQRRLLESFESQIAGGKRYDLATLGRRRDRATFDAAHQVDGASGLTLAMDLTALVRDPELEPEQWLGRHIDRFRREALERIDRAT